MRAEILVHQLDLLYTLDPAREDPLGELREASVGFADGRLIYAGPAAHAPGADVVLDGSGCVALPGLVDCHTHTAWAGSRADEFQRRLAGASYSEILESGGGILSTVAASRAAGLDELTRLTRRRLERMRARGSTTVEVKSGYGLDVETELTLLRAARACSDTVRVVTTFLGAHTIPAEWRHDRAAYVAEVVGPQLTLCAPHAEFIDVYCDRGAFTLEEAVQILEAGRAAGLKLRAHAEQVAHTGIAAAAADLGALTVDHLERIDDPGMDMLAECGTVACLLPGAQLYLRDVPPPVAGLRARGVPMAVATDYNPGSSPVHDLWVAATLGCILQGLTVEEAIQGITRNAGRALGRPELGWLGPGSAADLVVVRPPPGEPATAASLVQHLGGPRVEAVIADGRRVA